MGFLAPWFLAGAAVIVLPIYLHLLRRHATTPRRFSSLMFFQPRTQSSARHRRLSYLLLLAWRVALVALLALAFADPFITRSVAGAAATRRTLVVVDRSFSMRAGTRLADAKRQAEATLASLGPSDHPQVAALAGQLVMLTQPTDDTSAARAAIAAIAPGDERASFSELVRAVRLMTETDHTAIVLHLFSDMQQSAMPATFADMALPAGVRLVLHPVGGRATAPNWTVESVTAPHELWGQPGASPASHVQAIVAGYDTPAATRTVSLVVNGRTVDTRQVEVPPSGRATVEFPSLDVPYGFSRCDVRIDAADSLPADDTYHFAVERSDPQRVLFVHRATDTRSPFYFGAALGAAVGGAFTLQPVTVEQLGEPALARYAFVVLSDLPSIPAAMQTALDRYVRNGGGVLVALGPALAGAARVPFTGEAIGGVRNYARDAAPGHEPFLDVGRVDTSDARAGGPAAWSGVKVYYAIAVTPADARVAVQLADGTPLLIEERRGEGRVSLFTSSLDNLSNDFPIHPAFVPFVAETARYLAGAAERAGARTVDTFMTLRNAGAAANRSTAAEVVDPEGRRPLSLQQAATADSFRMTEAGFYQFRLADGRQDVVGVNADRLESNLARIPASTLALWQGQPSAAAPGASPAAGPQKIREPLWRYVMLLVLIAALVESWLSGRYLGTAREEPGAPSVEAAS